MKIAKQTHSHIYRNGTNQTENKKTNENGKNNVTKKKKKIKKLKWNWIRKIRAILYNLKRKISCLLFFFFFFSVAFDLKNKKKCTKYSSTVYNRQAWWWRGEILKEFKWKVSSNWIISWMKIWMLFLLFFVSRNVYVSAMLVGFFFFFLAIGCWCLGAWCYLV